MSTLNGEAAWYCFWNATIWLAAVLMATGLFVSTPPMVALQKLGFSWWSFRSLAVRLVPSVSKN